VLSNEDNPIAIVKSDNAPRYLKTLVVLLAPFPTWFSRCWAFTKLILAEDCCFRSENILTPPRHKDTKNAVSANKNFDFTDSLLPNLSTTHLSPLNISPLLVRIDIVTLFPDFFSSPLSSGLLGKALAKEIALVNLVNPRDFAMDKHRRVDDEPYGGGVGMLMKPEPIFAAVESLPVLPQREIILMTPQGEPLRQPLLRSLASYNQLIIICGHYEGVDERVLNLVTREVSLGDFVLTCGEIPALALINGVIRLLPGTVGKEESLKLESFEAGLLDYPQYTRPAEFRGWKVPDVLLSGNHGEIAKWRRQQQIDRTRDRRPDLLDNREEGMG